jgi:hypothetical protein
LLDGAAVDHLVVDCGTGRAIRRVRWIAQAFLATALLAGCGGNDSHPATPTATSAPNLTATFAASVTTTPQPPPEVAKIVWATAIDYRTKAPVEVVDGFTVDDTTLYAALQVRNLRPNATLTAHWTYNKTSLDGLATTAVVPSGPNSGWVEFHLTRSEEPWPDGTYAISVSLDGKVVQTAKVSVVKA